MNKPTENIDQLFKSHYENHRVQPKDKLWQNISAELSKKGVATKSNVIRWVKIHAIVASVALIAVLGYLQFNSNNKETASQNNEIIEPEKIDEQQIVDTKLVETELIVDNEDEKEIIKPKEKESNINSNTSKKAILVKETEDKASKEDVIIEKNSEKVKSEDSAIDTENIDNTLEKTDDNITKDAIEEPENIELPKTTEEPQSGKVYYRTLDDELLGDDDFEDTKKEIKRKKRKSRKDSTKNRYNLF